LFFPGICSGIRILKDLRGFVFFSPDSLTLFTIFPAPPFSLLFTPLYAYQLYGPPQVLLFDTTQTPPIPTPSLYVKWRLLSPFSQPPPSPMSLCSDVFSRRLFTVHRRTKHKSAPPSQFLPGCSFAAPSHLLGMYFSNCGPPFFFFFFRKLLVVFPPFQVSRQYICAKGHSHGTFPCSRFSCFSSFIHPSQSAGPHNSRSLPPDVTSRVLFFLPRDVFIPLWGGRYPPFL